MKIGNQDVEGVVVEVIERTDDPHPDVILPNEIRINGRPVLAPTDEPVIVHEVSSTAQDLVRVTLTLYAKRVTFSAEPSP
jgi:hypothetical protein